MSKKVPSPVMPRNSRPRSMGPLQRSAPGESQLVRIAAPAVLIVAAGLVYANSFAAPLVFDGDIAIVNNAEIREIKPHSLREALTRPLGFLTFKLNYAANVHLGRDGFDVWTFHALNLAIHIAAGLVLFGIVRRTLIQSQLDSRYAGAASGLALATALVWLVHPLDTSSVTYIYQRLESLMSLLYLLALYGFIRAQESHYAALWYVVSVLCGMLAVTTKEVALTLPLAVLWYDRVFVAPSWRQIFRQRWPYYLGLAGIWVVLGLLMWFRKEDYPEGGVFAGPGVPSPLIYALSQSGVLLHYLRLAFWPTGLCLDYNWPAIKSVTPQVIAQTLAIFALLGATLWCMVRRPKLGFVAGMFFLILAPTSSIAPLKDLAFEHRMYLPLAAIAMLVVLAAFVLRQRLLMLSGDPSAWEGVSPKLAPALMLLTVGCSLAYLTYLRNEEYRTAFSIWDDTVRKAPENWRAYLNRGFQAEQLGDSDLALADYNQAIALKSDYLEAYNNRGVLFRNLRRYEEALRDHTTVIEELELKPTAKSYYTRAFTYGLAGNQRLAIRDYDRGLALDESWEKYLAHFNRGNAHLSLSQFNKAIDDYNTIIDEVPDIPELVKAKPELLSSYKRRGLCYGYLNRPEQALDDFNKAIQLAPSAETYTFRAECFIAMNRYSAAIVDMSRAIDLQPKMPRSYLIRAKYYYMNHQYPQALEDVKKFHSLGGQPDREFIARLTSALNSAE